MGTANNNGGTIISFPHNTYISSRMPSHHPNGSANFTFQIPSIVNTVKKNTNTAERRANHNAVERARRECLNTKFQDLARALPSLSQVRRPSKSIIVQRSLEFIYNVRQKEDLRERELRNIRAENESLREEVNKLRKKLGMEPIPPTPTPSPSPLIREDSNSSSSSNSNTSSSQSTSSTSSPYLQQLTDEPKEDVEINDDRRTDEVLSEKLGGKMLSISDHNIDDQHDIYNSMSLIYHPTFSMEPPEYSSDFFTNMDITSSIDQMVDPSLQIQFEHNMTNDLNAFCSLLPQKIYPSPPSETTMLSHDNHIPGFQMLSDNSLI